MAEECTRRDLPRYLDLIGLGPELLLIIAEFLPRQDIKSLRLVSSYLNDVTRSILYRNLTISLDEFRRFNTRLCNVEAAGLMRMVRSLKISGVGERIVTRPLGTPDEQSGIAHVKFCNALLCSWISRMPVLDHMELQGPAFHPDLINVLSQRNAMKMRIQAEGLMDQPPQLLSLRTAANLHSLHVRYRFRAPSKCRQVMDALRHVLLNCPALRVLKLDVAKSRGSGLLPERYCGMGFRNGEKPLALRELDIIAYPFGRFWHTTVVGGCQSSTSLPGRSVEIDESAYWADVFDWSQLQRLRAPAGDFVRQVMPRLSALEDLSTTTADWQVGDIETIFLALPTNLKAFEVDSVIHIGETFLRRQSKSLRKLVIHSNESSNVRNSNSSAYLRMLRDLREHCNLLEELAVDVPRNDDDWSYEILVTVATFDRVHTLTLHCELGILYPESPRTPLVTFAKATKLFKYLRQVNPQLGDLTIHSGLAHEYKSDKYMDEEYLPGETWEADNSTTFASKRSNIWDGVGEVPFLTECPILSHAEDEAFRDLLDLGYDEHQPFDDVLTAATKNEHCFAFDQGRMNDYR